MNKVFVAFLCVFTLLLSCVTTRPAPAYLAPPEITGEVVYIPFPVDIVLDGDLSDWAQVAPIIVERGNSPAPESVTDNSSFTFALAARDNVLYAYMTTIDSNIITGQHETNFWNEDSMEIYLNLTDNLWAEEYAPGIFQININPGNIGNTDPLDVVMTGTNAPTANSQTYVFRTENGWGFEMAIPLPFTVEHGREIGVQAHANGALELDRNIKLIWSLADTGDTSYQRPRVFGIGQFYQIGTAEIPPHSVYEAPIVRPFISVNQTGYFANGPKIATFPHTIAPNTMTFEWSLVDAATDQTVLTGTSSDTVRDAAAARFVTVIDFSDFSTPGTYFLRLGEVTSAPFAIGHDVFDGLAENAMRYFYLNRSGIAIDAALAGGAEWARPAGHLSDADVEGFHGRDTAGTSWPSTGYRLNASRGWYDAGDYGKYVVNGGISEWTLVNLYELFPDVFPDSSLSIPERGNGAPDILDEARWEMEFLLGMQIPEGYPQAGMAHHKLHAYNWDAMPSAPPSNVTNRFLMPASTAATLNLAATAAQSARVWAAYDPAFAARCLTAARRAWRAALDNPVFTYGSIPGNGGGDYGDATVTDEFYWAAAELYVATGEAQYRDFLSQSPHDAAATECNATDSSAISWGSTASLARITLALAEGRVPAAELARYRAQIVEMADRYMAVIASQGFRVPLAANGYVWGSNGSVLDNALLLAYAYRFTGREDYRNGVIEAMDYLLGRNVLNISYIAGYGENPAVRPHHRFWANQPTNGFPPVPAGAVVGGPNANPTDEPAMAEPILARGPAGRYIDNYGSYSTNEVAINWNAPLAWVAGFLDSTRND